MSNSQTPAWASPVVGKTWHDVPFAADLRLAPRALVAVDVAPINGVSLCGQLVPQGVHAVIVYKDQLPVIQAKVRTPAHLLEYERAREVFELKIAEEEKTTPEARAKTSLSPEAIFAERYKRGMPPLRGLVVLDEDVPPPDSPASRQVAAESSQQALTEQLVNQGLQTSGAIARMAEAFEKLAARLDRLEAQPAPKQEPNQKR